MTRNINDNKTYGGKGEARKCWWLVLAWGIGLIIKEAAK